MALDRYFVLKSVVILYAYIAVVLGALIILGSIIVIANGQLLHGIQSTISALIFMAWAFLGYYGVTRKQRCHLTVFAVYLVVSFIVSLIILAILPSDIGEISSNLQLVLVERLHITDNRMLTTVKILLTVEAFWKIFTSLCTFWLTHLIRIEQRNAAMGHLFKG